MYAYHGLKGSHRIIFEDLCRLIDNGDRISIRRLADESGYSAKTVWRSLIRLHEQGLVEIIHPYRGARAEYRIVGGEMIDLKGLLRAFINVMTMSPDTRAERWMMVYIAKQNYNNGCILKRLAEDIGGDFEMEACQFLDQHKVLDVQQIWPLDEAKEVYDRLESLIIEAQSIIEDEYDFDAPL